jgi:hypothetical protein
VIGKLYTGNVKCAYKYTYDMLVLRRTCCYVANFS